MEYLSGSVALCWQNKIHIWMCWMKNGKENWRHGKILFHGDQNFTTMFFSSQKTLPFQAWSESYTFACSILLAGPCKRRAFWADSAPFVDTGPLVDIRGNYREPRCSQVKMELLPNYDQVLSSFVGWQQDVPCWVSSKSPSLVRAWEEEGTKKQTRVDSS